MDRGHRVFAAVYDTLSRGAERRWMGRRRGELIGDLTGEVLEVGGGTGANLPYYRAAAKVTVIEPDPAMRVRLTRKLGTASVPVEVVDAPAERLPFEDERFAAAVSTLVLCSVADQAAALAEIRRVLRPGGRLVFIEHVRGQGRRGVWQDRVEPLWGRLGAGCHPNRDTRAAIEGAGFAIGEFETFQPKGMENVPLEGPFIQGTATR